MDLSDLKVYPQTTVAIFNNKESVIIVDDHCYVINNQVGREWKTSAWIFKEALEELRKLPQNPDKAVLLFGENKKPLDPKTKRLDE